MLETRSPGPHSSFMLETLPSGEGTREMDAHSLVSPDNKLRPSSSREAPLAKILPGPLGETWLIIRHRSNSWPNHLIWGSQGPKDPEELVDLRISRGIGPAGHLKMGKEERPRPTLTSIRTAQRIMEVPTGVEGQ